MDFLPGTASLVEEVDMLRDGRKLFGILRSFDQFANIVLESTIERIYVDNRYGEKNLGLYLIRGENVVLLGEIDPELEEQTAKVSKLQKIPFEEAKQLYKKEQEAMFEQQKQKRKLMQDRGIAIDPFTFADNLLAFE